MSARSSIRRRVGHSTSSGGQPSVHKSLKVLVVAGGEWQVPLVRKVKELGFTALCSSLYPDSPAFKFADGTFIADVRDRQANLAYAREQKVDAVLSDQSDMAVPTVAYICEQLGLPG